jgi:DNA processing protein
MTTIRLQHHHPTARFEDTVPSRRVGPGHPEWPPLLDELGPHRASDRLFVAGRPLPTDGRTVAVVGTRRPTAGGVEMAVELAGGLAQAGFTVVSGLAVGIDAAAHRAALECGGTTVAVLGCGLDVNYPVRNEKLRKKIEFLGTLVSEYPAGVPPAPHHFPSRNRIIVGMSSAIVVVEGTHQSGALITARIGLDANRHVFAVPGSVRNRMATGPNELIRTSQAALVTEVEHIFEELAPSLVWQRPVDGVNPAAPQLEEQEARVLFALDDTPAGAEAVGRASGLEPGAIALSLARLEVRGLAVRRVGGYEITGAGSRAREALLAE